MVSYVFRINHLYAHRFQHFRKYALPLYEFSAKRPVIDLIDPAAGASRLQDSYVYFLIQSLPECQSSTLAEFFIYAVE